MSIFKLVVMLGFVLLFSLLLTAYAQAPTPAARLENEALLADVQWHPSEPVLAVVGDWGVKIMSDSLQELASAPAQGGIYVFVSWNPNGQQPATGGTVGDGTIRIWDWNSSTNILTLVTTLSNNHEREWVVAWSPDGTRLAMFVRILTSIRIAILLAQCGFGMSKPGHSNEQFRLNYAPIRSLSWNSDSTELVFSGDCKNELTPCPLNVRRGIYIADAAIGEITRAVATGNYLPTAVVWSVDDRIAASSILGVDVYDAQTLQLVNYFSFDGIIPYYLDWSPNARQLAYTYEVGSGGVLDIETGNRQDFSADYAYSGQMYGFDWNDDGSKLASVTEQGYIEIWNTGQLPSVDGLPTVTPLPTRTA